MRARTGCKRLMPQTLLTIWSMTIKLASVLPQMTLDIRCAADSKRRVQTAKTSKSVMNVVLEQVALV